MLTKADKQFIQRFGERVRALREKAGLSVIEAADLSDISRAQFYRIEEGSTNCSLSSIKRIADALDVKVSRLMDV